MFHKVRSVVPLEDGVLLVQFAQGVTKRYDTKPLCAKWPAFETLRDPLLWQEVQVDLGGYGISWNDEIDLSCDELFANGTPVATPFDGLLAFGDATALWGLNESTLRKAIVYGKLHEGTDAQKFGKQWLVTEAAMRREYGEPIAPRNPAE